MKNNIKILTAFLFLSFGTFYAQTGVGTITPDASSVLDVYSTTKGFLLPRHTDTTRDNIVLPAKGLMIFNTSANELQTNTGTPVAPIWTASGTGPQGPAGSNATVTGTAPIDVTSGVVSLNDAGVTTVKLADNSVTINKLPAGATATTFLRGDGTWVTPSGGSSVTASNGLTLSGSDVQLGGTLSASTTIIQNNNDLTFTTGTGRTKINGTFQTTGAVYAKVRKITSLPITWADDDYVMIIQVSGIQNIVLPDPTLNAGRVLMIRNNSLQAGTAGTYTYLTYPPVNSTSILASRGQVLVSDGTSWYLVGGV